MVRLQPAGPKRQAGGKPTGLQTPGTWLPGLGVGKATPAWPHPRLQPHDAWSAQPWALGADPSA